jgi:hypothetical protein
MSKSKIHTITAAVVAVTVLTLGVASVPSLNRAGNTEGNPARTVATEMHTSPELGRIATAFTGRAIPVGPLRADKVAEAR